MTQLPPTILVNPGDLVEDPTNANEMSDADFAALCNTISTVGFLQPVLVVLRDGVYYVVDGHHRRRAAVKLGMPEISAILWDGSAEMLKVVQLGMNRIRGDFNLTRVSENLAELIEQGWSAAQLGITGFSDSEIAALLEATVREVEEHVLEGANAAPAAPPEQPPASVSLEVEFVDATAMRKAKRALKRIAKEIGQEDDLSAALLHLLKEHDDDN